MNKKRHFITDVITLSSVPIFSQILGFFIVPIVTRLYAPDEFGVSNLFGTIVMLFATFSTMGYHRGIILPKNDKIAIRLVYLCFLIIFIVTLIVAFILLLLKDFIIIQSNSPTLGTFLWLSPLFVFFHGIYQVLRFWNLRSSNFGKIAISRVVDIISKKAVQLLAGVFGYATAGGLIIADLFAIVFKNLSLIGSLNPQILFSFNNMKFRLNIVAVAKRYKKFPKYFVWSEWLIRIPMFFTSFIIAKYFGQDTLGYYSLALLVLSLPSLLIGGAVAEVLTPRSAEAKHRGEHGILLIEIFSRLLKLLIFPFVILGFFGDSIFSIVFSSDWIQAGIIAQILVIRVFFDAIFAPTFIFINILEKQELDFLKSVVNTIIVVGSMVLGVYFDNFQLSLWLISIFDSLLIIALGIYLMRLISLNIYDIFQMLIKYFIICVSIGLVLGLINSIVLLNTINFLFVIFITTIVYYFVLILNDQVMYKKIKDVAYNIFK